MTLVYDNHSKVLCWIRMAAGNKALQHGYHHIFARDIYNALSQPPKTSPWLKLTGTLLPLVAQKRLADHHQSLAAELRRKK